MCTKRGIMTYRKKGTITPKNYLYYCIIKFIMSWRKLLFLKSNEYVTAQRIAKYEFGFRWVQLDLEKIGIGLR